MNPEAEQPIEELRDQELEPSTEFLQRVRGRIQRRTTAAQVASYSWNLPRMTFLVLGGLLGHLFSVLLGKKETST